MKKAEALILSLLKGEFSSLTIGFNDLAAPNYMTAQEADEDGLFGDMDWVSLLEKAKAISGNSVWTLHWYPDTPIGSCRIAASSLTALLAYIAEEVKP